MSNIFQWIAVDNNGKDITSAESNFKDVLKLDSENRLHFFDFYYNSDNYISVNLHTGFFELNGFKLHPCPELKEKKISYRIIFYQRTRMTVDAINGNTIQDPYPYRYLIGWQAIYENKNIQRIIFLDPETFEIEFHDKR